MSFRTKLSYYWEAIKKSWTGYVIALYALIEFLSTQSNLMRELVGNKYFAAVMLVMLAIARFRPSKILPTKADE